MWSFIYTLSNICMWRKNKELEYISNFIISILFLIQHNRILSRAVVYKKAFDISRKGSHYFASKFTVNFMIK